MIGQTFGRYRIVEKIGEGGMGEVYRAHDEQLDRDVALKVLPTGILSDDAARKRFRKEALALAKLSHPHIGVVHEFGTQDGVEFLVMEYIPGKTLSERLARGSLPEKEIVSLGQQIAAALEEAHEQGVIHRDLKPGNILVTPKGQAKVLDFGLAKLLKHAGDASATETLSETQAGAGTLPYMAPEQLRGEATDARSDIFALGNVLYQMATGQRAFQDTLASRLIDAILHQSPLLPRAVNRRISPELERIILKCLEKDPKDRYQSVEEVSVDLRRLRTPVSAALSQQAAVAHPQWPRFAFFIAVTVVLAVLVILLGLNVARWHKQLLGGASTSRIDSLAVLPFVSLSGDPEQEYFVDGMTEALITSLAQISALKVISRTSVMQYKGAKKPLPEIGQALHVDVVVEGSAMRSGDRVRISAQLVEAATDRHLWAESYERDLRDVLALQSEVAQAIAREVKVKLTVQEQARLASARPVHPKAVEAYLKGRYFWNKRTGEGFQKGIEYFEQAIEQDSNYALAYAGLADSYLMLAEYGLLPAKEGLPRAKAAAAKALELDDTLAEAHTSLGSVKEDYDWDWLRAEREFKRAIELNPSSATAHQWYAEFLAAMGRFNEAMAEITRARELDPLSLIISTVVGELLYESRHFDQAVEQLSKTLEMDPNFAQARRLLGECYEQKAQHEKAVAEFKKAIALSGDNPQYVASLARIYAVSGKTGEARKMLERLKVQSGRGYVSSADLSLVYVGLGDKDQAFELLQEAYEEHVPFVVNIKVDPRLDSLRSDARFEQLMRRVGLTP